MNAFVRLAFAWAVPVALAGCANSAEPPVVTRESPIRIWVDQIGYPTSYPKIAIVASDSPIPDGLRVELREDKTGRAVWSLDDHPGALARFNEGAKDKESGEFLSQLDFSSFHTPGRYYLAMTAPNAMRSYKFSIADKPYRESGLAAWKAYYYNRADGEISEKYGGPWNHGVAYRGPHQATEARVYRWKPGNAWHDQVGTELIDPKAYDVHGGWFDAGDFNKYTGNTVQVHDALLMAYEMVAGGPKENELNIPESGNGKPDVLNEIRFATEFLIRDHDGTGAAFGRVHQQAGSPPESVTDEDQLTMPNSEVTMGRVAALAYAAVVWRESGLDEAFASKCLEESKRSWNLLKRKPHPWPVDPDDPTKLFNQGEMRGDTDYPAWRLMAAACYFRITGEKQYDAIVHEMLAGRKWDSEDPMEPALWVYLHAKAADPAIVALIKKSAIASADQILATISQRGYHMAADGYWWGSNSHVGNKGSRLVLASMLTSDVAKRKAYLEGAAEYVHYLYGRNPLGMCYFSNMKSFGVEQSAMVMFHGWVGNENSAYGQKYVGEAEGKLPAGKIGPFPGYVIGGAKDGMRKLVEVLDWRQSPWEWTEPDIGYQAQVLRLMGPFIWAPAFERR
jgi:hypothetical protein